MTASTKGRRRSVVVAPSLISHGTALEPNRLRRTTLLRLRPQSDEGGEEDGGGSRDDDLSELFVTMCFFARLGFDQPPCCLHCAYHNATKNNSPTSSSPIINGAGDENNSSSGGNTNNENNDDDTAKISECHNLIPWRIDASILLHPTRLTLSSSSPPRTANDDTTNNSSNTTDDNNEENEEEENSSSENGSSSSNIVFITCTTAQCLVNGECYPCLRYDGRNKRLLLF